MLAMYKQCPLTAYATVWYCVLLPAGACLLSVRWGWRRRMRPNCPYQKVKPHRNQMNCTAWFIEFALNLCVWLLVPELLALKHDIRCHFDIRQVLSDNVVSHTRQVKYSHGYRSLVCMVNHICIQIWWPLYGKPLVFVTVAPTNPPGSGLFPRTVVLAFQREGHSPVCSKGRRT